MTPEVSSVSAHGAEVSTRVALDLVDISVAKDIGCRPARFKRSMNPKEAKGMKSLGSTSGTEKEKSGLARSGGILIH